MSSRVLSIGSEPPSEAPPDVEEEKDAPAEFKVDEDKIAHVPSVPHKKDVATGSLRMNASAATAMIRRAMKSAAAGPDREAYSWNQRREAARRVAVRLEKWLCGPFLGHFEDKHVDPDDDREEREAEAAAKGKRYIDMPIGRLKDDGCMHCHETPAVATDDVKTAVLEACPETFLSDLWETIQVEEEFEKMGVRRKVKRYRGRVVIDQLKAKGPTADINKLMQWAKADEDPFEEDKQKQYEAAHYHRLRRALTEMGKKLHTLQLTGCDLREVPPVLREVPTLKVLKLSHNEIKLLTEEWLWDEAARPKLELIYRAKDVELLTGRQNMSDKYRAGVPAFRVSGVEQEDREDGADFEKYKLGERWEEHDMLWESYRCWGVDVVDKDNVLGPDDKPSRWDCEWLLAKADDESEELVAYPMELEGQVVILREENQLKETGSVISGDFYRLDTSTSELPQLEHLFLDWNRIYSIEVSALSGALVSKLQVLNLSNNELNVLPQDFLENAKEIKYLDLSGNRKIRNIPDTVMQCSKMELLFLSHNAIAELPPIKKKDSFGRYVKRLKKLRKLFIAYNQLTCLPEDIGYCSRLEKLRVMHNKISEMPESLLKLRHTLLEFAFVGNPLQQPLRDAATLETNMQFFEEYWKQKRDPHDVLSIMGSPRETPHHTVIKPQSTINTFIKQFERDPETAAEQAADTMGDVAEDTAVAAAVAAAEYVEEFPVDAEGGDGGAAAEKPPQKAVGRFKAPSRMQRAKRE